MTAWLGATHALQRKIVEESIFAGLLFTGAGIVCHNFDLKTYRDEGMYLNSLVGMATPLTKKGERAPFIEEARCSLEVSLVLDLQGVEPNLIDELVSKVYTVLLSGMHIAGGDILDLQLPSILSIDDSESMKKLRRHLMPGYVLIEKRSLVKQAMQEGLDGMDAVLEYLKVFYTCSETEPYTWEAHRKSLGWIIPIATGFQAISEHINSPFQRDMKTPHRFAESIVTLGEFVMPHRINRIDEMFWSYQYNEEQDLYLCINEQ
jgi:CRISPR-associated protein Csy2